jgi:S-DNA-T family DNA segregation ATPase FtsK/SpoIIIE
MSASNDTAVVPADPVLDGELLDDDQQHRGLHEHCRRPGAWWQRSSHVPASLKSRADAVQAAKDVVVAVVRAPWRWVSATARGAVMAVRAWRCWVTVRDYREAAELSEKLADKYVEIRELTLFRWRVTGAVTGLATAGIAVTDMIYGSRTLWITAIISAVGLAITGRRKDGSPGRRAVLAGPRSLSWTMDPQILVDAFRDAKLIGKDETLRLVQRARRVGEGWAITMDLPATRKATDVVKTGKLWPPRWPWMRCNCWSSGCGATVGTPGVSRCGSLIPTLTPRRQCPRRSWRWRAGMPGGRSRSAGTPEIAASASRWCGPPC